MSADQASPSGLPADLARSLSSSPPKLAAVSTVCMLLFLVLPAAYVSGSMMGISSAMSFSGSQMGGWTGWLALVAFAAAATTRFVPSIAQYRRIADLVAFGMVAAVLIYAAVASPIAEAAQQVRQVQAQFGGLVGGDLGRNLGGGFGRNLPPTPPPVSFSLLPHIGLLPFVLAPLFLFVAKRRERIAVAQV